MKSEQIILSATGILMLIDTGLFYYASMSQYFLFCASAILLYAVGLVRVLHDKNSHIHLSAIELLFFGWFIYLIIRGITTNNEQYKLYYLFSCYLLFQGITWLIKNKHLSMHGIRNLFIGLAVIESAVCLLQWFGILESEIPLFKVSGTWESPNVTAMFIALCIPLLIEEGFHSQHKYKIVYFLLIGLEITAILLINCRTAYISLLLSVFILFGKRFEWFKRIKNASFKRIITITIPISLLFTLGCYGLYKIKQPSADGRFFIWKNSLSMIAECPIRGYGYGLFEKKYNLYQSDILKYNDTTKNERKNARHVFVCYNDFLEQSIEGGIISGILYLSILLTALFRSAQQRDYESLIIIGNCIWMSTVNFVIHANPLMFILIIYVAHTAANDKNSLKLSRLIFYTIAFTGVVTSVFCSSSLANKYHVQRAIRQATDTLAVDFHKALDILRSKEKEAETSECFWRIYGRLLLHAKDYNHAQKALEKALEYTSNPSVQKDLVRCIHLQNKF